jgi:hypothetical protein
MDVAPASDYFSSLIKVVLITYDSRGDNFEEFRFRHLRKPQQVLNDTHIGLYLNCGDKRHRKEWFDQDYDPIVCEIVEFLERLT